ncbi:MAG: hypothetical protein RMM58_01910 [Chloroflexota bacterium]|nr:hypothetical protein [Dehalococcoidia bacterium]MDW8252612.1 hypothetical protein [Chloroflexota bacterium]
MPRVALLVIAAAWLLVASSTAAAQPVRFVALEPAVGTLDTVFTVTGTGFLPGEAAIHRFTSPDGLVFSPADDLAALHLADEQGVFQFQFVPLHDFVAPSPGQWTLTVCLTDRRTCATLEFTLTG